MSLTHDFLEIEFNQRDESSSKPISYIFSILNTILSKITKKCYFWKHF
jgi:hypothetical protein